MEAAGSDHDVEFGTKSYAIPSKMIEIRGEVDKHSAPKLREKIFGALSGKHQIVVLDLANVTYMDSAGVAVLVEGIQRARREKIILSLRHVSKAVQSVFEVARVEKLFMISGDTYIPAS